MTISAINTCKKSLDIGLPEKAHLTPADFPTVSLSVKKKKVGYYSSCVFLIKSLIFHNVTLLAQSLG